MKAAFTKETDFFAERGITYLDPALTLTEPQLLQAADVREPGARCSGVTEDESDFACDAGVQGDGRRSTTRWRRKGKAILDEVEAENRVARR